MTGCYLADRSNAKNNILFGALFKNSFSSKCHLNSIWTETIERLDRSDDPTEPIFDQEVFDKIYSLCRGMAHLPSALRLGIVECLARSLRSLNERIFDQLDEMPNVEV